MLARPARVGRGDDRPVDQALGDERAIEIGQVAWLGLADERGIEIREQFRLRPLPSAGSAPASSRATTRPRRAGARGSGPASPRGRARSRRGARADPRSARRRGSRRHGRPRATIGARRRRMLDLAEDHHLLTGLNVRADANRELGVAAEPLVGVRERSAASVMRASLDDAACRWRTGSTGGSDLAWRRVTRPSRSRASGPRGRRRVPGLRERRSRQCPRPATAARVNGARWRAHRRVSPRCGPALPT